MKNFIKEIADKYVGEEVYDENARQVAAWDLLSTCSWFDEVEEYH